MYINSTLLEAIVNSTSCDQCIYMYINSTLLKATVNTTSCDQCIYMYINSTLLEAIIIRPIVYKQYIIRKLQLIQPLVTSVYICI